MSLLSLDSVVGRRPDPLTAPVDGDLAMFDPRQGRYFGVDAVGHRIWDLLERPQSVAELCRALQLEFDVPAETCQSDVLAFLRNLDRAELLEVS
jgi:hypothetical protein